MATGLSNMVNVTNKSSSNVLEDWLEFQQNGLPVFIYLIFVCILGTLGNMQVIIVYIYRYQTSIYKIFILCLATVDLLACVFCVPSTLYLVSHPYTVRSTVFCKISRALSHSTGGMSLCLLNVIAVERFRKICFPTKPQITLRQAKILCVGVLIFSLFFNTIPVLVLYGVNSVITRHHNLKGFECTILNKYNDQRAVKVYRGIVFLVFVLLIGLCLTMYILVYKKLLSRQRGFHSKRKQKTEVPSISKTKFSFIVETKVEEPKLLIHVQDKDDSTVSSKMDTEICTSSSETSQSANKTPDASENKVPLQEAKHPNSRKKESKKNKNLAKGRKRTAMFCIVSLISFGCYLPYLITTLIRNANRQGYDDFVADYRAIHEFLRWAIYLNNAINPIVYGIMNQKFRQETVQFYKSLVICKK